MRTKAKSVKRRPPADSPYVYFVICARYRKGRQPRMYYRGQRERSQLWTSNPAVAKRFYDRDEAEAALTKLMRNRWQGFSVEKFFYD